jgi:transposase
MIFSKCTNATIARTACCSTRSVRKIRSNLRCFGTTKVPLNGVGRRRTITPPMLSALLEQLIEKPELYQDEMAIFLYDEFEVVVTTPTISRALALAGWSRKAARRVAKERNADLRDFYLHNLSEFRSYHLVYINESGCDNRIGFRRTRWSPLGVTPVQIARLH